MTDLTAPAPLSTPTSPWRAVATPRHLRLAVNVVGAASAAYAARGSLRTFAATHGAIVGAFVLVQTIVAVGYLRRRPARAVSRRASDWGLAVAGTFGVALLRPGGAHVAWAARSGLGLQAAGLALVVVSLVVLGRSFGFAPAERGLVQRGPYAVVRHPVYGAYLLLHVGFLLQSLSWWNAFVVAGLTACNAGRARAEDRVLASAADHATYRDTVRWRMVPGVW